MTLKEIRVPERLFRHGEVVRADQSEDRRLLELSFSSEEPVQRGFGMEILGHGQGEIDARFMGSGRAPLLVDHRATVENQIGIVESVSFSDGKGRAVVRFGKTARADDVFQRVADGEISNVSVGYRINALELVKDGKNDLPTYRVTSWTPFEISLVSVPADTSVGIGRSADAFKEITLTIGRGYDMPDTQDAPDGANLEAIRTAEVARIREIEAIGAQFNCRDKANEAVRNGHSVDVFRGAVLLALGERGQEQISAAADIGLTRQEIRQFSFVRALHALANPNDRAARESAKFEFECSDAAAQRRGQSANGVLVPADVMRAGLGTGTRALNTGVSSEGGALVGTNVLGTSFIDLLRARTVVLTMGARMLNDLQGNIAIPRMTSGATAYWVGEGADITKSQAAFDQVVLSPKRVGAFTDYSKMLLLQSSLDVEAMVRDDLAKCIGLEITRTALHGSGSANQPKGVAALTGVNSQENAGTIPTWAEVVGMETAVASDEADVGALGYIINPAMRGGFKTTEKAAGTARFIWEDGGTVNGYRAGVTTQVMAGNAFYANWEDLLIAFWSGVDLTVDMYTQATNGTVRVIADQAVDIAGRHPGSFCHAYPA